MKVAFNMDFSSIIINPWVGFVGTVIGVVGFVLSIVFYLRSRRFQRPTYYKNSIKWFDGESLPHDDIKLTFQGKVIPRFTITHLYFWNSGNQTIKKSDFVTTSPLRITIPENTEIFDIHITASTANEIQASIDSTSSLAANTTKEVLIDFDYLDANDGFSVQIIHDAKTDSELKFVGKLPGVPTFKISDGFTSGMSPFVRWFGIAPIFAMLGSVGIWSVYSAIFNNFHWYQVLGGLMVVYFIFPLKVLSEAPIPKPLWKSTGSNNSKLSINYKI